MKHYGYTAAESIALCRICRPGSIVGPQQQFLHDLEYRMKNEGNQYRRRHRKGGGGLGGASNLGEEVGSNIGTASSALSHPVRHRAERRLQHQHQHQPYMLTDWGPGAGGDRRVSSSSASRRPTTSPLIMRRHSTSYSGGGGGGGVSAMSPTDASRRRSVGNRWTAGEKEQLVVSGGGASAGGGLRSRGAGSGINCGRGKGLGKGTDGSSNSTGLQRPRRRSSPSVRQHGGDGAGRGAGRGGEHGGIKGAATARERVVGDLMETLRLSGVKKVAAEGGGGVTDRAPVASTARGKLVPLATSSTRPTTSTTAARNRRKLSGGGVVTLQPEERTRVNTTNSNLGLTTSPVSPKNSAAVAAGNASTNGRANSRILNSRTVGRNAAAAVPGKASLAWQHPVDKKSMMSSSSTKVDREEEAGWVVRDGHERHGGPWAAAESIGACENEGYL